VKFRFGNKEQKPLLVIFIFNSQETQIWNLCYRRKHNQSISIFLEKLFSMENRAPEKIWKRKYQHRAFVWNDFRVTVAHFQNQIQIQTMLTKFRMWKEEETMEKNVEVNKELLFELQTWKTENKQRKTELIYFIV